MFSEQHKNEIAKTSNYCRDLESKLDRIHKLLIALTPGGSEYTGDIAMCIYWIKERLKMTAKIADDRNKERARVAELEAELAQRTSLKDLYARLANIREETIEECARLHESIAPYCDHDPKAGSGAMGAIIRYRDEIRRLIKF